MPITKKESQEIFGKLSRILPRITKMFSFDTHNEAITELGRRNAPPAPAFYSAGSLYLILDRMNSPQQNIASDLDEAVFIVAHEIGHHAYDPQENEIAYFAWRLWAHHYNEAISPIRVEPHASGPGINTEADRMWGASNIFSDIVINRTISRLSAFRGTYGAEYDRATRAWYHIDGHLPRLRSSAPDAEFRDNFLGANMALGWLEIHEPANYQKCLRNLHDPHLKTAVAMINRLIDEKGLATRDVQAYYDVCVALFEAMRHLARAGYAQVV